MIPVGLHLDADIAGANGYMEQVIHSRESIELVAACILSGNAPPGLVNSTNNAFLSAINLAIFVRPSTATLPVPAPVDSW